MQGGDSVKAAGILLSTDHKPRLRWTNELHGMFLDAVMQLGGPDKATPKSISKVMNVKGVTLHHLKSHLQKYRLGKHSQQDCDVAKRDLVQASNDDASNCITPSKLAYQNCHNNMQMSEALRVQMEVQQKLREQLEVQRLLQLHIEAQGRYLQSIVKKTQQILSCQNPPTMELAAAQAELSDLARRMSSEFLTSHFAIMEGKPLTGAVATKDCPESCLTSPSSQESLDEPWNGGCSMHVTKRCQVFCEHWARQSRNEEFGKSSDCEMKAGGLSLDERSSITSDSSTETEMKLDLHDVHCEDYQGRGAFGPTRMTTNIMHDGILKSPASTRADLSPKLLFSPSVCHQPGLNDDLSSFLRIGTLPWKEGNGLDLNRNWDLMC